MIHAADGRSLKGNTVGKSDWFLERGPFQVHESQGRVNAQSGVVTWYTVTGAKKEHYAGSFGINGETAHAICDCLNELRSMKGILNES